MSATDNLGYVIQWIPVSDSLNRRISQMNKRTAKALEESIEHHKQNLLAETPDDVSLGVENCALCELYIMRNKTCAGCPVAERAGNALCTNTPYKKLGVAHTVWCTHWSMTDKHGHCRRKFRAAEKKEIEFLESLRD